MGLLGEDGFACSWWLLPLARVGRLCYGDVTCADTGRRVSVHPVANPLGRHGRTGFHLVTGSLFAQATGRLPGVAMAVAFIDRPPSH